MAAVLWHAGLTVKDMERSVRFYCDVAGMVEERRAVLKSDAFDTLTNNRGADILVTYLSAGPFTLQLVQYLAGGAGAAGVAHNSIGSPHLCFRVADVEKKFRDISARGHVNVTSPVVQIRETMRSFYVADPDGVPVEFLQYDE
jgi:catechol 2,3-dioxygenase-like lactoylglutathione lyase family enzyme